MAWRQMIVTKECLECDLLTKKMISVFINKLNDAYIAVFSEMILPAWLFSLTRSMIGLVFDLHEWRVIVISTFSILYQHALVSLLQLNLFPLGVCLILPSPFLRVIMFFLYLENVTFAQLREIRVKLLTVL